MINREGARAYVERKWEVASAVASSALRVKMNAWNHFLNYLGLGGGDGKEDGKEGQAGVGRKEEADGEDGESDGVGDGEGVEKQGAA